MYILHISKYRHVYIGFGRSSQLACQCPRLSEMANLAFGRPAEGSRCVKNPFSNIPCSSHTYSVGNHRPHALKRNPQQLPVLGSRLASSQKGRCDDMMTGWQSQSTKMSIHMKSRGSKFRAWCWLPSGTCQDKHAPNGPRGSCQSPETMISGL